MRSIIALVLASMFVSTGAMAAEPQPWYESHPAQVHSLKQALAEERSFLAGNPFWQGHTADAKTCAVLKSVGLSCDFNTRATLTDFLTVNGKDLFPAAGGTNPYYTPAARAEEIKLGLGGIDNGFIGHARQNAMLADAVRRNAHLFHKGDLTAADVRTKWR